MKQTISLLAMLAATPVAAATKNPFLAEFYSLKNTDFVVAISFLIFIGILLYMKVPSMLAGMLDKRAEGIESELNEARALRDEAQAILASYERKQLEVQEQAERIVSQARESAAEMAEQAKLDLAASIDRRVQAAEDQITSAEQRAVKQVRDEAASIAIAAASEVIAKEMSAANASLMIDDAIKTVQIKLQ